MRNKPQNKKMIIIIVVLFLIIGVGAIQENLNTANNAQTDNTENLTEALNEQLLLDDESSLEVGFEQAVQEVINNTGSSLLSITMESPQYTGEDNDTYRIEIESRNHYTIVEPLLEAIANCIVENDILIKSEVVVYDNDSGNILKVLWITSDGEIVNISQTSQYKDEHYEWLSSLFSVWDGSNEELNDLIIEKLLDKKSYEHLDTTYIDINSEEVLVEVENLLTQATVDATMSIGDVVIITTFASSNAFGVNLENTAYGLASYTTKDITLLIIQ